MHRTALAGFVPRRVVQRLAPAEAGSRRTPPGTERDAGGRAIPRGYACAGASCSPPAETTRLLAWSTLESSAPGRSGLSPAYLR